jgi:serine/threonine protein kinase
LKEKLKVTKVPEMKLKDVETEVTLKFDDLYKFIGFLGTGSFGFVVQAVDRKSGEMMALKVSIYLETNF